MDDETYHHISDIAETVEYIDFEIPEDAPSGKSMSDNIYQGKSDDHDRVPVNLDELFNGHK